MMQPQHAERAKLRSRLDCHHCRLPAAAGKHPIIYMQLTRLGKQA